MAVTPKNFFRGDLPLNPTTLYTVPSGFTAIVTSVQVATYESWAAWDGNFDDYTVAWVKFNGIYGLQVLASQFTYNGIGPQDATVFTREVLTAGMTLTAWRAEESDHITSDTTDAKAGTISMNGVLIG